LFLPNEETNLGHSRMMDTHIEHSAHDHNFDCQDYIAVVQDRRRQDQCHDNNHGRRNNQTGPGHATIDSEDIARMVCNCGTMQVWVKPQLECKMPGRSCHVASRVGHLPRASRVLDLYSSPDLFTSTNNRMPVRRHLQSDWAGHTHPFPLCDQKRLFVQTFICGTPAMIVNDSVNIKINCSIGDQTREKEQEM
jgi:hypothetical protein